MAGPNDQGYFDAPPDATPQDPAAGLGQPYIPTYGPQQGIGYGGFMGNGDGAAYQTQLRAAYGNNPLFAMGGLQTVGGGPIGGGQNALSSIGSRIMPLSYTPPAFVVTGFSGRYIQRTGIVNDIKNMIGFGSSARGARDYDISLTAAEDLGERAGLGMGGAAMTMGEIGVGAVIGRAGLLAGFGAYYVAGKYTDAVRKAVVERREIENYLGTTSDRFITASAAPGMVDPRRGSGLSYEARRQVSDFIREMDVKDPMLNMKDLTSVLKGSVEAGMFTGTRDMDDFKRRFKDVVENVKVVATTLHQTLEEGVKTMRDLRSIGIDPSQARGVVLNAESAGRVAGRTAGEMLNLGLQGGELFRGTGVDMKIGFQSNIMNMASIRAARDAGMISNEAIAQAGGEESLAQRMTASGLGFAQSAMGRGMAGAFFNAGQAGSGFDQTAFMGMLSGKMDMNQIALRAAANFGSPQAMLKFQANQAEFTSEMGRQFGGQGLKFNMMAGLMTQANMISQATGASREDALKVAMLQSGMSEEASVAAMAEIKNAPGAFEAAQKSAEQTRQGQAIQEAQSNFFLSRAWNQFGDYIKENAIDPVAGRLNKMVVSAKETTASLNERLSYGIMRVDLGESAVSDFFGDVTDSERQAIKDPLRRLGKNGKMISRDLDLDFFSFSATAGSDLAKIVRNRPDHSIFHFERVRDDKAGIRLSGDVKVSSQSLEENAKIAHIASRSELQAQEAEAKNKAEFSPIRGEISGKLTEALASGQIFSLKDLNDVSRVALGKSLDKLTPGGKEYDALLLEVQKFPTLRKIADEARSESQRVIAAERGVSVAAEKMDLEAANRAKSAVESAIGVSGLSQHSMAQLVQIADMNAKGQWAEVAKAETQFKKDLASSGMPDIEQVLAGSNQLLQKVKTNRDVQTNLQAFAAANRALVVDQETRGSKVLDQALEVEFTSGISSKLADAQKTKIKELVAKVSEGGASAVEGLSSADIKALKGSSVGGLLVSERQEMDVIRGAGSAKDLAAQLKQMEVPETNINRIVQKYQEGGATKAIEAVHAQTMNTFAGQTNMAVAGGSANVGTAAGTGQDQYAIETSINLQVLQALQALNRQLKN